MSRPTRHEGPTHWLIIPAPAADVTDWEVEHPPECTLTDVGGYDDYDCGVAFEVANGTDIDHLAITLPPGRHPIRHWTEMCCASTPFGPEEWDGGLELVVT